MPEAVSIYILELQDGRLYVGQTNDPVRRHQEHDRGHASSRTSKVFGAGRILYVESHPNRTAAAKREAQLKKWSRAKKLALINGDTDELHRLAKRRVR